MEYEMDDELALYDHQGELVHVLAPLSRCGGLAAIRRSQEPA